MKLIPTLFPLAFFAVAAAAQQTADLQQTLLAKVNDLHTAHQHVDANLLFKTVSPDLLYLGHTGRFTFEEMFSDMPGAPGPCLLGSFKVTDPQLRALSADSAVLTYHLHQQSKCNDVPEPSELNASDAFVKINGEWRIVVHTETPLM